MAEKSWEAATRALTESEALLLIRIAANESGETQHQRKKISWQLLVAEHATQHGIVYQTNRTTINQKRVLVELSLKAPNRYLAIPTPKKA